MFFNISHIVSRLTIAAQEKSMGALRNNDEQRKQKAVEFVYLRVPKRQVVPLSVA